MITAKATVAQERARINFSKNLNALDGRFTAALPDAEFVFGRDGALTARDGDGQWFSGSSVPHAVAAQLLENLSIRGQAACMLAPTHPAQIAVALSRLEPAQTLFVILPEPQRIPIYLACECFEAEITAGRLHLILGSEWPRELEALLQRSEGLAVPTQFIRLPISDASLVEGMIPVAQQIFARITSARNARIDVMRGRARRTPGATPRICVVAPSRRRMFEDSTSHLLAAMREQADGTLEMRVFDPDQPGANSTLLFAQLAAECDAIVSADLSRADLPHLVNAGIPWITWVTASRIPAPAAGAARDSLILCNACDVASARAHGWPSSRIACGCWRRTALPSTRGKHLAIFADTSVIEIPPGVADYSSQELLWDALRQEIDRAPLSIWRWNTEMLATRADGFQIPMATIDASMWLQRLIVPAFQQSLARQLIRANLPLKLYGRNWDKVEDLRGHHAGDLVGSCDFKSALADCAGIVHALPLDIQTAADFADRPVLRPGSSDLRAYLRLAREIASGRQVSTRADAGCPELSLALIRKLLSE